MNVNIKTPKGNKININFISNPKKPDMSIKIKE